MKKHSEITQKDLNKLITKAGKFIGTDKDLRTWDCIAVALDHAQWLRNELNALRKKCEG